MKKIFVGTVVIILCLSSLSIAAPGARSVRGARGLGRKVVPAPIIKETIISPKIIAPVVVSPIYPARPVIIREKVVRPRVPHEGPEFGLSGGLFGNIPSIAGDAWFHKILGINGTAIKTGLRYAQGEDSNKNVRKNVLVVADGIFDLNGGPGAKFYVAGGLNYLAYTTGQTNGTIGGQVYLGVEEGSFAYGSLYAEAGYGVIRTGFSPIIQGLNLNFGMKSVF